MSTYLAHALTGMRAVALIGILPGAIVAAAYLLVLTGHLYRGWDVRTAVVLGMAVWGLLGVIELWRQYVRLARTRRVAGAGRPPVNPRVVLLAWALILVGVAAWKVDTHPQLAGFLVIAALYSSSRAFGLFSSFTRRTAPSSRVARARVHGRERPRARTARAPAISAK